MNSGFMSVKRTTGAMMGALGLVCVSGLEAMASESWSGIYIGGHAGLNFSESNSDLFIPAIPGVDTEDRRDSLEQEADGFLFGAQVGAQLQHDRWVYGIEASWSDPELDFSDPSGIIPNRTRTLAVEDLWLAGVRVGRTWERSLVYGKVGYASAEIEMSAFVTEPDPSNNLTAGQRTNFSSETEDGWHIGGGYERQYGRHLTFGLDYNYVQFEGSNRDMVSIEPFRQSNHENIEVDIHVVTARASYKFNTFR